MVSPAVFGVKILHACLHSAYRTARLYLSPADLAFPPLGNVQPLSPLPAQETAPTVISSRDYGDPEEVWRIPIDLCDEWQETIVFHVTK